MTIYAKGLQHDLALTDKRKPTVNPYGLIYRAPELSTSDIPVLDPVKIDKSTLRVPVRDQDVSSSKEAFPVVAASPYFGIEAIWDTQVNAHTPTMDQEGRVYFTAQLRSPMNMPAYCSRDSGHPSAQAFLLDIKRPGFVQNSRQVTVYDPKTRKFSFIDTCLGTHHLNFAEDANNTLWLSNNTDSAAVVGWVNTKMFWQTGDAAKSQGWTALVVDTNGNGKRDDYRDGRSIRCRDPGSRERRASPKVPHTWVDQHDTFGLGADTPITTGNFSDSLYALTYGKVIQLRVPYPMGFFAKGLDGRIDDARAGWKGKGLWATTGTRTPAHIEGIDAPSAGAPGKTLSSPLVVHFQMRPDPLAH